MARKLIFLFLIHVWLEGSLAQHSPFSLQAAVDALHRREAQLALKDNYNVPMRYAGIPQPAAIQEQDYWDDETETGPFTPTQHSNNRHRLNRMLAKYLAREEDNARTVGGLGAGPSGYEFDDDNYLPEEKKRSSFFRERDDSQPALIHEPVNQQPYDHSELTDQFLKEIEEARELDREERYKEALRRIWERYQQQENELESDIFEDQKRMTPQPNYYIGPLMQKKRSYPVLPWLPMSRRKRFPVAKRSPKMPFDETSKVSVERVPDELRELFGKPNEEKKKRSTDGQAQASTDTTTEKKNETSTSAPIEPQTEHPPHGGHHHKEHKHRKRSDHFHDSQEEEEEDSEENQDNDEPMEEEEDSEEQERVLDEEDEPVKKKRELTGKRMQKRSNLEVVKEDQILPGDLSNFRGKKSIQWSKYFGIDRRKKSGYDNASPKNTMEDEENEEDKRKKKNIDPERLSNMGKKLQSIEDLIIDETVKYTGAHEGIADPEEIARLKDHVVSRLATAYSLEKMRRALEKLRQSVDNENHLLRNVVESESKSEDDDIENQKRLSVKKEKVEFQGLHHSINTPNNEKSKGLQGNSMAPDSDDDEEDKKKKKQKKRNGFQRYPELPNEVNEFEEELGAGHYEPLNDAYLGNKNYVPGSSNQCPLIDSMAQRCRGVDLLSGDINQELLPICGVHQICYLCGTSQVACDFQYLAEADSICGHNNECQSAARSVLMILRGSPGPQLGPKECIKNPCLNRAMREIGL